MKFFTRGLVLFVLSLGMFVMAGCGADNESEGEKLAKTAGDPGPPNPKAIPSTAATTPGTGTEADRGKRLQQNQSPEGYPGSGSKKTGR